MIQALGCGINKNFNPDKLRYNKIIILTDADINHINHIDIDKIIFFPERILYSIGN